MNVDVCVFLFDLLYIDGKGMMHSSFRQRRQTLKQLFVNLRQGFVEMANGFELEIPAARAEPATPAVHADVASSAAPAVPETCPAEVSTQEFLALVTETTDEGLGTLKQCGVRKRLTLVFASKLPRCLASTPPVARLFACRLSKQEWCWSRPCYNHWLLELRD